MNEEQLLLRCLLRRVICGKTRIHAILHTTVRTQLRKTLLHQKIEYSKIEADLRTFASAKGWCLHGPDPLLLFLSYCFLKMRVRARKSDSHAVSYMIQSCTQGMIDSLKVLHRLSCTTYPINRLAQKLMDCEYACILQLQGFL